MTAQDRSDWLSVEVAARRLGVSPATLKRRIDEWTRDGRPIRLPSGQVVQIEAEKAERPQGHVWLVRLIGALPPISTDQERSDSEKEPPLSTAQDRSETVAALLGLIETEREERQRLTAENADLRERVGRAEADASHATARAADLAAQLEAARAQVDELSGRLWQREARASRPWWRRIL